MAHEQVTLALMGMDQHENGVMAVTRILKEAQMGVSYLGKFQTPDTIVEGARRNGAQVIGISCHSWEYLTLVPALIEKLRAAGSTAAVVIGGSVITAQDAARMRAAGVAAVFAAGARDIEIVDAVRALAKAAAEA